MVSRLENTREIKDILKFYYEKGKNVIRAAEKICDVYGRDTVFCMAQSCGSSVFNFRRTSRSGLPITGKVEIMRKIEQNRHGTKHRSQNSFKSEKVGYKKKLV